MQCSRCEQVFDMTNIRQWDAAVEGECIPSLPRDETGRYRMLKNYKEFFAQRNLAANSIDIYGRDNVGKSVYAMSEVLMTQVAEGDMFNPLLKLTNEEATSLMTELWSAGVRPNNGEGNPGHIGALKAHLEDMRKIAFSYIDLQK